MTIEGTIAAIFYFSNFALSATAIYLAIKLFCHHGNVGWLILACAFSEPFVFLLIRIIQGRRWFTYVNYGPAAGGIAQVTFQWEVPYFYFVVVAALVLLVRGARQGK